MSASALPLGSDGCQRMSPDNLLGQRSSEQQDAITYESAVPMSRSTSPSEIATQHGSSDGFVEWHVVHCKVCDVSGIGTRPRLMTSLARGKSALTTKAPFRMLGAVRADSRGRDSQTATHASGHSELGETTESHFESSEKATDAFRVRSGPANTGSVHV